MNPREVPVRKMHHLSDYETRDLVIVRKESTLYTNRTVCGNTEKRLGRGQILTDW